MSLVSELEKGGKEAVCPHCQRWIMIFTVEDAIELDAKQVSITCSYCRQSVYVRFNWGWKGCKKPRG